MTRLVVIGAGGFARETLDVVDAVRASGERLELLGVVDDAPSPSAISRLETRGYRHLGTTADYLAHHPAALYVVAIGDPAARRRLASRLDAAGHTAVRLVHPSAVVGSATRIGAGSVVCAGAQISTNADIGRHVHVNAAAVVGHDTVVHDTVSINPGAVVSGDVVLSSGTLVGAGAVILQGRRVGRDCIVGAAACVTHDVPDGLTVVGVPARPIARAGTETGSAS